MNKIPTASRRGVDVQIEWYINALSSNIAMFLDRAQKTILADNMKEDLAVKKRVLSLQKKFIVEERKRAKKLTFKEELKKKASKDPFDVEGL